MPVLIDGTYVRWIYMDGSDSHTFQTEDLTILKPCVARQETIKDDAQYINIGTLVLLALQHLRGGIACSPTESIHNCIRIILSGICPNLRPPFVEVCRADRRVSSSERRLSRRDSRITQPSRQGEDPNRVTMTTLYIWAIHR